MATVKFTTFSKRRNSTKQPTSVTWDTRSTTFLKEPTSQDRPIFKVSGNNFNYNYCEWDGKYYFINDIESLINNEIAVHCILDPLATYKSDITATTQFVCYSASATRNAYLVDTRIPVLKKASISSSTASMSSVLSTNGFYVLTVVGKDGCNVFAMDLPSLQALIDDISTWQNDGITDAVNKITVTTGSTADFGDGIATLNQTLATLGEAIINSGFVGNAYSQAPSCIRSCIWVPLFPTPFLDNSEYIWLGNFKTSLPKKFIVKSEAVSGEVSVSIPWQFTGWKRSHCEDVYIYLPLVGNIALSSDALNQNTSLHVKYSVTATDGVICYEIYAVSSGGTEKQIVGTYGGQCSANYPIGISQQASAGQLVQTAFAGTEKMLNTAINSSISPVSMAGAAGGAVLTGVESLYNIADVSFSRNNTCVGGIGGGAGSGLDFDIICYTVAHDTVIPVNDADYIATMGVPVMKAMSLSTLTGYCQCANAHVEAPATAEELDAIDAMVNSGFYIE